MIIYTMSLVFTLKNVLLKTEEKMIFFDLIWRKSIEYNIMCIL